MSVKRSIGMLQVDMKTCMYDPVVAKSISAAAEAAMCVNEI